MAIGDYAFQARDPKMTLAGSAPDGPVDHVLRPRLATVDLGSREVATYTYGDAVPGPVLRLRQGRGTRIRVENGLPDDTSVHWHGIRLRNAADGVPGMTQEPIARGSHYVYAFTPPDAGTYLYHSHSGMQIDRGLYGALVVEATGEPGDYDHDEVIVLDDWLDGIDGTPDERLATLRRHGMAGMMGGGGGTSGMSGMSGMGGMGGAGSDSGKASGASGMAGMMGLTPKVLDAAAASGRFRTLAGERPTSSQLAGVANLMRARRIDVGDVVYPLHLANGRDASRPWSTTVRTGDRMRLRIVGAASDTAYLVFVEGHEFSVTHADGQPVTPVRTEALLVAMGERYDVLVDVRAASRLVAVPLGKRGGGPAIAQIHTTDAGRARGGAERYFLPVRVAGYEDLIDPSAPPRAVAAQSQRLDLAWTMPYRWSIGDSAFDDAPPIEVGRGDRRRFVMRNTTTMPHPMHLHGHSFRAAGTGPLKDTIIVPPLAEVAIDWTADNPGAWAFHCHDAYHMGAGMMRMVVVA